MAKRRRVLRSENGEIDCDKPANQEQFAGLAGCSQQEISRLVRVGVLSRDGTATEWCRYYYRFLMGMVYARRGWAGLE